MNPKWIKAEEFEKFVIIGIKNTIVFPWILEYTLPDKIIR